MSARVAADAQGTRVTVILSTHERARFLPTALACYAHQSYPNRELLVMDDSAQPIRTDEVAAVGGRVIRMEPGTPVGTKLNRGVLEATGLLCQKMDDDDWYAPDFLEQMIGQFMPVRRDLCRPVLAAMAPFLFFDLVRWRITKTEGKRRSGATFLFLRQDALDCPFRAISTTEDTFFMDDLLDLPGILVSVSAIESFLQIRHGSHVWVVDSDGARLDERIEHMPQYARSPEQLLPDWALRFYRGLRNDLVNVESWV